MAFVGSAGGVNNVVGRGQRQKCRRVAPICMVGRRGSPGRRGPPRGDDRGLERELVQKEWENIVRDYEMLTRMGNKYGKFDRDGKLLFIQQWRATLDRVEIHLKRFELSDSFEGRLYVKQAEQACERQFGTSPKNFLQDMRGALRSMEADAKREA